MPRLLPGCHLYEGPDQIWRYYLPGDRFVRITAPAGTLRAAQRLLHGHPAPDPPPDVEELISALAEQGVLAGRVDQVRRGRVQVHGTGPIAEQVRDLLAGDHDVTTGGGEMGSGGEAGGDLDVVVSCAGWLPDAAWRRLGAACSAAGVAWHGCYAEGTRWFAGPMAVPGETATYEHTRARRLGACGVPDELRAHWSYLDRGEDLPPVPWPSAGVCAIVAGIIAADVHAYLRDTGPAAAGQQLEIDPATLAVSAHPVLPLPFG